MAPNVITFPARRAPAVPLRDKPPALTIILGGDSRTAIGRTRDGGLAVVARPMPFPDLTSRT